MPRIPEEVINDIRNKARIENVISQYINVIRKGNSYVAMCPFHDDHSPSLHISVDKQIFKCFSCPPENGSQGDVFRFVMKFNHCDYVTAVKTVAEMIGYDYDFGNIIKINAFKETPQHKILNDTCIFCQHELNSEAGIAMKNYLEKRHIPQTQVDKFQIGYNPKNGALYRFLSKKGYSDNDIIEANVCRLSKMGMVDVFADRLMIPISDKDGHVIGFTARSIDPDTTSKYINTSETSLFHKSDVLFNYHRAVNAIREKKYAIICEGPMDVMAFDKAGMANAICSMGTSFTSSHLQTLHRITNHLILSFDGDRAGQDAIYKAGKMAIEQNMEISIINNTTKLDPDEIVNQIGPDELKAMVEKSITWMEFLFKYYGNHYDLNNYSAKKEFSEKMMEEISKLTDEFDKANYLQRLSQLTGFSEHILNVAAKDNKTVEVQQNPQVVYRPRITRPKKGTEFAEKTIIKQMMLSASAIEIYKKELYYLPDELLNNLAIEIIDYYSSHDSLIISEFVSILEDGQLRNLVLEISDDPLYINEANQQTLIDAINKIKSYQLDPKKSEKRREAIGYNDEYMQSRVADEYADLTRKQKELKGSARRKS